MLVYSGNDLLADKVELADDFFSRLKGLMGKTGMRSGEGLLLMDCTSVHCFFMKIAIDAVYLSRDFKVVGIETLPPWRLGSRLKQTAHVLELAAGSARIEAGDVLSIVR